MSGRMKMFNFSKEEWTKIFFVGLKLCVICAIAALVLALVNSITAPIIKERDVKDEKAALTELFPGGEPGDKQDVNSSSVVALYEVTQNGSLAGYVLELSGSGYGGYMKIMASYLLSGEILNVKLMNNEETPGLGKNAENPEYMKKFIGRGGELPIPLTKDMLAAQSTGSTSSSEAEEGFNLAYLLFGSTGADTDSVSGATITFAGLATALEEGAVYIKNNKGGA